MPKYLFAFIFLILNFSTFAQVEIIEFEDESEDREELPLLEIPAMRLGISPTAILNGFPAAQFSIDSRINDISEWSLETGYIFSSAYQGKGFRLRGSYELYLFRTPYIGMFAGAAITNTNVWEYVQYTVLYEDTYFREHAGFRRRSMLGGYLTGGFKFNLGQGVMLELSSGIGFTSFYTSTLIDNIDRNLFGNTIYPSTPGWTPFPGYYNNINISIPVDPQPIKDSFNSLRVSSKSKSKNSGKKKKPRKKKRKKKKKKRRR